MQGIDATERADAPRDIPLAGGWPLAALPWAMVAAWAWALRDRYPLINHDTAFLTGTAERWLDGESLYTGISQPNPPLAYWIHVVPVLVHRATGFALDQAVRLWLVGVVALGCAVMLATMRAVRVPGTAGARHLAFLAWVVLVTVHTGYDFGQREDVVLALIGPWLVAAAGAIEGRRLDRRLGVIVGLVAFGGFGMKPFFPLVWGVVEAWVLLRTRSLRGVIRVENVVLFGVLAVYALYMLLFTGYVGDLRIWAVGYPPFGALGAPFESVWNAARPWWIGRVLAAWLVLRLVTGLPAIRPLDEVVALAIPVFVLLFVVQGHGFGYQTIPAGGLTWWLHALVGLGVALRLRPVRFLGWGAAFFAGWLAWKGGADLRGWWRGKNDVWPAGYGCEARPEYKQKKSDGTCKIRAVLAQLDDLTDPGDPVAWLSPTVLQSGFIQVMGGVKDIVSVSSQLLPDLYPPEERFAEVFPYHPEGRRHPIEQKVLDALVVDLERAPPVLITFDVRVNLRGFGAKSHFDLVTFYRQDPRIASWIDRDYVEVPDVGGEGTIRWFVRKDRAARAGLR